MEIRVLTKQNISKCCFIGDQFCRCKTVGYWK